MVRSESLTVQLLAGAASLACAPALRSTFPDEPWGFFPAVKRADAGGDYRRAHLWMEDPVEVSFLVVAASNYVSHSLGPYPNGVLAYEPRTLSCGLAFDCKK